MKRCHNQITKMLWVKHSTEKESSIKRVEKAAYLCNFGAFVWMFKNLKANSGIAFSQTLVPLSIDLFYIYTGCAGMTKVAIEQRSHTSVGKEHSRMKQHTPRHEHIWWCIASSSDVLSRAVCVKAGWISLSCKDKCWEHWFQFPWNHLAPRGKNRW